MRAETQKHLSWWAIWLKILEPCFRQDSGHLGPVLSLKDKSADCRYKGDQNEQCGEVSTPRGSLNSESVLVLHLLLHGKDFVGSVENRDDGKDK